VVLPQFHQKGPPKLSIWLILSQLPAQFENKAAKAKWNQKEIRPKKKRKKKRRNKSEKITKR
jgi:hypothetical protein